MAAALVLLLGTTAAVLIGLNAECNGPTTDCPHSDAYRYTALALPVAAAVLLAGGTAWSILRRSLRPLVFAEAGVLGVVTLVGAVLNGFGAATVVLLTAAFGIARAASPWTATEGATSRR
jgi:hypothetical protein